jgi:hypothetical protein
MARDIYNRNVELGSPMAADAIRVLLSEIGDADFLMQSVNFRYQQTITRLWELGSVRVFMFAGRTEGDIQAKRVIGPKNVQLGFVEKYGDVCNMQNNHMTLKLQPGCTSIGQFGEGTLTASGVVINSVSYAIQAQDKIINEEMAMMFVLMEKGGSAG